ncbi:MAG: formate hydrogenlyase subunit 3/multisubunit Na+/H+ antiporter MnhD subunit [Planctomycetota bacterium]|jgi:formate hydrogenlyase subunit 3/multisubunit Na+/H+ antiporter MnhD subunit
MINVASLVTASLFLVGARFVARTSGPDVARRKAIAFASVAFGCASLFVCIEIAGSHPHYAVFGLDFLVLPSGLLSFSNFVLSTCALVAVSLSPLSTHPPKTLGRMLLLFSIAAAYVVVPHSIVLIPLWALSAYVAWTELRSRTGPEDAAAARLFGRFQFLGAGLMLLGGVLLVTGQTLGGLIACSLGIALREAVIPLHAWFPAFVQRAPLGIVVAFAMPQLGVYAHTMVLAGELPSAMTHVIAAICALTATVAACLAVVQNDARRALAFLIMSQTGLIAFGLESESAIGVSGALVTWEVLALATTGFAMTLAALESRRGTLSLKKPCGSFERTPRMAVAFLVLGFASVGMPLTLGFVAQDLLVQGSIDEFPAISFALIFATAVNGMTVMRCFFNLFSGTRVHSGERDLVPREVWALTILMGLLVFGGAMPARLLDWAEPTGPPGQPLAQPAPHVPADTTPSPVGE